MKNTLLLRFFFVLVLTLSGPRLVAQQEDAKLESAFKKYLDESFRVRPLEATRMGDHRFDSELEDPTPEARHDWLEFARKTLADLPGRIDTNQMSRAGQIDYQTFQHSLVSEIWLMENFHPYEQDPRIYNGYINDSVYLLLTQSTAPKETNVANCIARMSLIPKVVATARKNL